jgi:RNA polymerase sigma factor (sigma-70 family)
MDLIASEIVTRLFSFIFKKIPSFAPESENASIGCSLNPMQTQQTKTTAADPLAAILDGDTKGLARLHDDLFPFVRKLATENGGTEEDAKDLFSEAVMLVFYKANQPGFALTSQFSTYFFGICRNLWGSRIQKKSFRHVTIPDDAKYMADETNDFEPDDVPERRRLFDRAFGLLGADCQRLLSLFFDKLPMDEIARRMGYASEGYARRRKCQCKDRLTELVKQQPGFHELQSDGTSLTHHEQKETTRPD